jgi:hypothetical protein
VEGWEVQAALSTGLEASLTIRSLDGGVAFTAYGDRLRHDDRTHAADRPGSSLLVERARGKAVFTQCAEMPLPLLR